MNQKINQLTLSYELLQLLQWLIENEPEELKKVISHALQNGFKAYLTNQPIPEQSSADEMHYNVIDFLGLLEILLNEVKNEQRMQRIITKKLMPVIDHIDTKTCDENAIQLSVEQASLQLEDHPERNPQEILLQELLRSWTPSKNTLAH